MIIQYVHEKCGKEPSSVFLEPLRATVLPSERRVVDQRISHRDLWQVLLRQTPVSLCIRCHVFWMRSSLVLTEF